MKQCKICNITKNVSEFNLSKRYKDGLNNKCRECNSEWYRNRYKKNLEENRKYENERKKQQRILNKNFVYEFLLKHPCVDCGEDDPIVLDFDHINDKSAEISNLIHNASLKRIENEIKKCEVRCANCHRRKTAKDLKFFKYNKSL